MLEPWVVRQQGSAATVEVELEAVGAEALFAAVEQVEGKEPRLRLQLKCSPKRR